jgi:hypothetical protein
MTTNECKSLIKSGWTHIVYAQYSTDAYPGGSVVSRHRSHEAAERATNRAKCHPSFLAVRRLSDYE